MTRGRPGVWRMLREDAPVLAAFFAPALFGWGGAMSLLLLGVPGAVGGALMLLLPFASSPAYLWGYRWADGRERRRRGRAFTEERLPPLAARVVALYGWKAPSEPKERARTEVFALFLEAQRTVEAGGNVLEAGEAVERGVEIADGLLGVEARNGIDATERSRDGRGG